MEGSEGVVGHNGYGIVNIGFGWETQLEGRRGEISIEYAPAPLEAPGCGGIDFPF